MADFYEHFTALLRVLASRVIAAKSPDPLKSPPLHPGTSTGSVLGITAVKFGITVGKHDKDDHQGSGHDSETVARLSRPRTRIGGRFRISGRRAGVLEDAARGAAYRGADRRQNGDVAHGGGSFSSEEACSSPA